jgi:GNAT superfamily N-acetyltransferase
MIHYSEEWNNKKPMNYIREQIIRYNASCLPENIRSSFDQFSILVNDDTGRAIGGITGTIFWQHLHIDFLWIDPAQRGKGHGAELLKKAERVAREKKCRLILLDTFSFQAPNFYPKFGYEEYGVINDHPKGFSQHFFQKRL